MHCKENGNEFGENKNCSRNHLNETHEKVQEMLKNKSNEGNSLKSY